jgi:hypothetical protein
MKKLLMAACIPQFGDYAQNWTEGIFTWTPAKLFKHPDRKPVTRRVCIISTLCRWPQSQRDMIAPCGNKIPALISHSIAWEP